MFIYSKFLQTRNPLWERVKKEGKIGRPSWIRTGKFKLNPLLHFY